MKNINDFLMFQFFLFPRYGVEILLSVDVCQYPSLFLNMTFTQNNATLWYISVVCLPRFRDCSLSPLLSLCHCSIVIVTVSVILLLAVPLLMLINCVHVCGVFLLTSWQCGSIALNDGPGQKFPDAILKSACIQWHSACNMLK